MATKITTYNELEASGDTKTALRPLNLKEALAAFEGISHGHVLQREDGRVARCGGPSRCKICKLESAIVEAIK